MDARSPSHRRRMADKPATLKPMDMLEDASTILAQRPSRASAKAEDN